MTDTTMKASVTGNGSLEVEELLVHEGDYVTSGTPLFRIKSKDVEDILDSYQDAVGPGPGENRVGPEQR